MRKNKARKRGRKDWKWPESYGSDGIKPGGYCLPFCSLLQSWLCWVSLYLFGTSLDGGIYTDYPASDISVGYWLVWWLPQQIPQDSVGEWNQRSVVAGVWKLHLELASYRKELDADLLGDEGCLWCPQKRAASLAGVQANRFRFLLH